MNDSEIFDALSATGICQKCNGSTTVEVEDQFNPNHYHDITCSQCNGTGIDPLAQLKAIQAVGFAILKLSNKIEFFENERNKGNEQRKP